MTRYLPAELIAGLHAMKGRTIPASITIRHLISNQTGLRDYFSLKGPDGRSRWMR
jgi:D-alanyl-D-alanine carboxypeptidase